MKIVIDGRMAHWTGIGRYTRHLVGELAAIDAQNRYEILVAVDHPDDWVPQAPNVSTRAVDFRPYGLAEQGRFRRYLEGLGADLVHFVHFNMPVRYRGRFVITIHDLTMLKFRNIGGDPPFKQLASSVKYRALPLAMRSAVGRARCVFTPSRTTAAAVAETFGRPLEDITITYEAPEVFVGATTPVPGIDPGRPFVLYVGNFYPHRNLETLVAAMPSLLRVHPTISLVMVGAPSHFQARLKRQVAERHLQDHVRFPGYVSDEELGWLYQNASVFVFPPLSEGFGLPGLEAMAYRTPVASSNASCLPEIYGEAAAYFDPGDVQSLVTSIVQVLEDPELRSQLVRAGEARVRQFSWRRMAEQTLAGYERATRWPDNMLRL